MKELKDTVFNAMESVGGFRVARYIARDNPKILMYHRIIDHPQVPAITPSEFEQQLDYLRAHFNVQPVEQLIDNRIAGQNDENAIAITFDDGHADFYDTAWPLLKKYELPASLYVTTGFVDNQCWLWPDLLRHILWETPLATVSDKHLPTLPLAKADLPKTWNTIASHCLTLASDARIDYIKQLAGRLQVSTEAKPTAPFNAVTWDNLRDMQNQGLTVGSHTVSHRILSSLDHQELANELTTSKMRIEKELGITVNGICYPNGMTKDISKTVEDVSNECGYQFGLVAYPANAQATNPMHQGRWAAPKSFKLFKRLVNGITRDGNPTGQHV